MPRLVIATTATSSPMGAQLYQEAVAARAPAALGGSTVPWQVQRMVARSLRSPLPGTHRLPMGWLQEAGPRRRRALGRLAYPPGAVIHRMDLILPPPTAGPDVITLHDVVAWRFADESAAVRAAARELRAADAVICVSAFTAGEAADLLGVERTVVIPNGVDDAYFDAAPLDRSTEEQLGLRRPYVLYAGGSAARKNLPGLARAWQQMADQRPEWQLALAGPTNPERIRLFADSPRVHHLGRVEDALMPGLVGGAGAVVVPSLYEGFGLPALEAMAAGTPLLSSNRSSLPEVVGGCGTLVDPTPDGLAEGLVHVTSGSGDLALQVDRGRLRARDFTWTASVEAHARVWRSVG